MSERKPKSYACPRCTVGRCLPQKTTFAEIHQGQLLVIPKMVVYVCDVCRLAEFEQETIEALWRELYGDQTAEDTQAIAQQKRSSQYSE